MGDGRFMSLASSQMWWHLKGRIFRDIAHHQLGMKGLVDERSISLPFPRLDGIFQREVTRDITHHLLGLRRLVDEIYLIEFSQTWDCLLREDILRLSHIIRNTWD